MIEPLDGERDGPTVAPAAGESPPATRRRIRRDVLIGAAAIAAVALIGKGLSNSSDAPSASNSSAPPSAVGRTAEPNGPVALPSPRAHDVAACPESLHCLTQAAGNGLALEPVRVRLPKAEVIRFHSVLLQSRPWVGVLWYRELVFRLPGGRELTIRISAARGPGQAEPVPVGAVLGRQGEYVVSASAPGAGLSIGLLSAIARDERLLTT